MSSAFLFVAFTAQVAKRYNHVLLSITHIENFFKPLFDIDLLYIQIFHCYSVSLALVVSIDNFLLPVYPLFTISSLIQIPYRPARS